MTYNLPDNSYKTQIFYQNGIWIKPQGISMIYITLISAGGGGAGGQSSSSGLGGVGGGGGAMGYLLKLLIPADVAPDSLRVTVGVGGGGGGANINGGSGGLTRIESYDSNGTNTAVTLLQQNGGGGGATGLIGGGGGGLGTALTTANWKLGHLGIFVNDVAPTYLGGGAGGSSASGTSRTYGTSASVPYTSGAGGGGKNTSNVGFNGGDIIITGIIPTNSGGVADGGSGGNGFSSLAPFIQIGGSGGAGSGTGTGGTGGNGGIGCGGGGGGAGITGGAGGRGGDGLVIINCW
jgi:hypothetical protein